MEKGKYRKLLNEVFGLMKGEKLDAALQEFKSAARVDAVQDLMRAAIIRSIRPVELLVTGGSFLTSPQVTARPVITVSDCRQDGGSAVFGLKAGINGSTSEQHTLEWELYEGCDGAETLKTEGCEVCRGSQAEISGRLLDSIRFWHFDSPSLYTLKLVLKAEGAVTDRQSIVFGFRDIHVRGSQIILNGEPVRLAGTEWMPGSDPACGMAEPKEALEKMLLCLKESNSILTRFHWQQDDWVYDWCDRHGMLVQEEVPFWGATPPAAGEQQWKIFKEQLQEMVSAHRNHPSVFAWGVGNELDGQAEETIDLVQGAGGFGNHRKFRRAGIEPFGADDKLVKADEAVRAEV